MDNLLSWDHVASAFGAITTLLLTYIINRQGKIDDKLDEHMRTSSKDLYDRVTKTECKDNQANCENLKHRGVVCDIASVNRRLDNIFKEINSHSHTGLTDTSQVIRKRNNG